MSALKSNPKHRILILGSGAREHALARVVARAPSTKDVVVAPGNGGIHAQGASQNAPIRSVPVKSLDPELVISLVHQEKPDLVIVGPEAPLCAGIIDRLDSLNIPAFGPTRAAARLEGSKIFMKEFATRHNIPTAAYAVADTFEEAERIIRSRATPIVVKADGLCGGKGVTVANTLEEALNAAQALLVQRCFGEAGSRIVIEDCLIGKEVSIHAVTDGERWKLLPIARDHKRIADGNRGANTGGMGAFAPVSDIDPQLLLRIENEIIAPTIQGMRNEGCPFRGVLFSGLMITDDGRALLLEHNVRFGDPECEAIMELVEGNFVDFCLSAIHGKLDPSFIKIRTDRIALVLVLAASGYPGAPRIGDRIRGTDAANLTTGVTVLHSGTKIAEGELVTNGGRVLAITAQGNSLTQARERAYAAADLIQFDGMQFRQDIGVQI